MNREIKFRIWDKQANDYLFPQETLLHSLTGESETPLFTIQQFTGLKDKLGIDMYEGDIIRRNHQLYVIIYQGSGFIGETTIERVLFNGSKTKVKSTCDLYNCLIMGNIFQHSDLLHSLQV